MQARAVLLIRHAKSSWDDISLKDFDRPLNERGKKDAPAMAKRLQEKDVTFDALISSPAKRAYTTAKLFAEEFGLQKESIIQNNALYEASIEDFYKVIAGINNDFKKIGLFSHNPGITAFSNILTRVRIDDIPTCGVFALHVNLNSWKDFKTAKKEFWFFDYPKNNL